VAVFGAGVAIFDDLVYGGPLRSGYRPGEITFSLSAVLPNFRYLPAHLMQAMPTLVLGLVALAWIIWRWARLRRTGAAVTARRDLAVALALAASWFAMWALYATYTWTSAPGASTLQVARFYVPALGAISLLGAWLVTRVPGRASRPWSDRAGLRRGRRGDVRIGSHLVPRHAGLATRRDADRAPVPVHSFDQLMTAWRTTRAARRVRACAARPGHARTRQRLVTAGRWPIAAGR
jgi:hypothetical protein